MGTEPRSEDATEPASSPRLVISAGQAAALSSAMAASHKRLVANISPHLPAIAEMQRSLGETALQSISGVHKALTDSLGSTITQSIRMQTTLADFSKQITQNINLGLESYAKFAFNFSQLVEGLAPALEAMRDGFYPSNLREIDDLEMEEVERVVLVEGIPLYGIPSRSTAEKLIRAGSFSARRKIIDARWRSIVSDCRAALESCESDEAADYLAFVTSALDAFDAGSYGPAQVAAATAIDALLTSRFGKSRRDYVPERTGKRTTDAYYEFDIREFIAFAPVWEAYRQFAPADGQPVPRTFSRHATAHTVSRRQFTRRNAVQGVMLATSLTLRMDEEARLRARKRARSAKRAESPARPA